MNKSFTYISDPLTQIKWMCHDVFITKDNQVVNLSFKLVKERVVGGSYGYTVNGKFHSKRWIRNNCVNVLGRVEY